jgi:hypothetical protein
VADSIAAACRDRIKAMTAVRSGVFVTVSDDDPCRHLRRWRGLGCSENRRRSGLVWAGGDQAVRAPTRRDHEHRERLKDVAAASRGAEAAGITAVAVRADGGDLDEALDRLEMGAR